MFSSSSSDSDDDPNLFAPEQQQQQQPLPAINPFAGFTYSHSPPPVPQPLNNGSLFEEVFEASHPENANLVASPFSFGDAPIPSFMSMSSAPKRRVRRSPPPPSEFPPAPDGDNWEEPVLVIPGSINLHLKADNGNYICPYCSRYFVFRKLCKHFFSFSKQQRRL